MLTKSSIVSAVVAGILIMGGLAFADDFNKTKDLKIASYVIGYNLGYYYNAVNSNKSIDADMISNGLKDGLIKKKPEYTQKEMAVATVNLQKAVQENIVEQTRQIAANNLRTSNEYLDKIAKTDGVQTLQKGLYYQVITKGTGETPKMSDYVTINYSAALPDGKVVLNTFTTNRPETFQVNKAILGWQQTLRHMPSGSVWTVYIAPSLAFGEKNAPIMIGPNQALTYKIQLLSVKPAV